MKTARYLSKNRDDTISLGNRLARLLKTGDIVCLFGELGSGKTTFTKGIAKGLKINEKTVNSPTFVLMNEYGGGLTLFHFDLYRLEKREEILGLGYEEYFYDDGVSVIEWADRLGALLPKEYLKVHFANKSEDERLIEFGAEGKRARDIIAHLEL